MQKEDYVRYGEDITAAPSLRTWRGWW